MNDGIESLLQGATVANGGQSGKPIDLRWTSNNSTGRFKEDDEIKTKLVVLQDRSTADSSQFLDIERILLTGR